MSTGLPQGFRRLGDHRVREVVGIGLDDIAVGMVIEHRPARTVTEAEHVQVLALMGNDAPVHSDIEFCQRTGRDRVLVCGILTLTVVLGMSVRCTSALTSANLAVDQVRFEYPVHVGDTLRAQSTIVSARRCTSRPDQGVIACRIEGHNQNDQRVVSCTRTFLVPANSGALRAQTDY